jgi:hypothetical protein
VTQPARIVAGHPTGEEAAAVIAAVQVMLDGESKETSAEVPWPYRSKWRRVAIDEGVRGTDVS